MGKAIGIDLGTTNSCVCIVEGGKPVIIPNSKGSRTTPSVVAVTAQGERLVGESAMRQAAVNSKGTVFSVKRQMGTDWKVNLDGRDFNAQEISAMILRDLKQSAESYIGEQVSDAVITVPAYFNDIQRQATKDAGRIAGLNVLRIINEPTSAALAYGLDNGTPQKIMVYDLGGGTFDVSIIEIGDGVIEVLATNGDNHLGGDDFDERVVKYLCNDFKTKYKFDITKDPAALRRIKEAAETAKKELSSAEHTQVSLPFLANVGGEMVHYEMALTRSKFNELTRDLVDRTQIPVDNALNDAGIAPSELGKVLLVGGSTRIPAVQEKVKALIGIEPSKSINPDECVAQGAAIQAETLSGGAITLAGAGADTGILLLDVTPLSLSIETVGGVATRLVERNTTLPVHYSQVFTTAAPYQRNVEIHVLQGERPMAADNKTVGKFNLNGIKRAPAGVPQIEVTFDIDTNGILRVSAKDLDTGKQQSITITANDKMSDAEIEDAIRDAQQYAAQDGTRRQALSIVSEATSVLRTAEEAMKNKGKDLDKENKKTLKHDCAELSALIAKFKPAKAGEDEIYKLSAAMEKLKTDSAMYL